MAGRRDFVKGVVTAAAAALMRSSGAVAESLGQSGSKLSFQSDYLELELSPTAPEFVALNVDGLGKGRRKWDGTFGGYEGHLTDDYYALPAVPLRQDEIHWSSGFHPKTVLT